jgi:hypothetical protein
MAAVKNLTALLLIEESLSLGARTSVAKISVSNISSRKPSANDSV